MQDNKINCELADAEIRQFLDSQGYRYDVEYSNDKGSLYSKYTMDYNTFHIILILHCDRDYQIIRVYLDEVNKKKKGKLISDFRSATVGNNVQLDDILQKFRKRIEASE